jgi:hypothetical protein
VRYKQVLYLNYFAAIIPLRQIARPGCFAVGHLPQINVFPQTNVNAFFTLFGLICVICAYPAS